jgi:hypothetical protein
MVKHSDIPVFLKDMNDLRNAINISNVGMPSPFPLIFFDMTQFTLDYTVLLMCIMRLSLHTFQCTSKTYKIMNAE